METDHFCPTSFASQMLWKPDFFGGELSVPALTKDECNNQQQDCKCYPAHFSLFLLNLNCIATILAMLEERVQDQP